MKSPEEVVVHQEAECPPMSMENRTVDASANDEYNPHHRRQGTVGVFLRTTDREHRPLSSASMCCCDWPNFSVVQVDYCLPVSLVISAGVSVDPAANELLHDCWGGGAARCGDGLHPKAVQ